MLHLHHCTCIIPSICPLVPPTAAATDQRTFFSAPSGLLFLLLLLLQLEWRSACVLSQRTPLDLLAADLNYLTIYTGSAFISHLIMQKRILEVDRIEDNVSHSILYLNVPSTVLPHRLPSTPSLVQQKLPDIHHLANSLPNSGYILNVYTDASLKKDGDGSSVTAGCGAYFDWTDDGFARNLNRVVSSSGSASTYRSQLTLELELMAICLALEYLQDSILSTPGENLLLNRNKHMCLTIWTDSAHALQSINHHSRHVTVPGDTSCLKYISSPNYMTDSSLHKTTGSTCSNQATIVNRIVCAVHSLLPMQVKMRKVGAHKGILGNEIADYLAKKGRILSTPLRVFSHVTSSYLKEEVNEGAARSFTCAKQLPLVSSAWINTNYSAHSHASRPNITKEDWRRTKAEKQAHLASPKHCACGADSNLLSLRPEVPPGCHARMHVQTAA
ncbi:hypothetical protein L7F22_013943 [Adiantum nelumboides]|nr:hypothetical protein [Adiantum nelumboides]MCO5560331.1 hypothetical protein [Adiantum nelumboides]